MAADNNELVDSFKAAFRDHPTGVTIITADAGPGPAGLTMSSVASVSVDPAVLSFSVSTGRGSASTVLAASSFVVHLLDAANVDLARAFATPGAARFGTTMNWSRLPTGEPWLLDVPTALRCEPMNSLVVGGSTIVTATVLDVLTGTGPRTGPLVHHHRAFYDLHGRRLLSDPVNPTNRLTA